MPRTQGPRDATEDGDNRALIYATHAEDTGVLGTLHTLRSKGPSERDRSWGQRALIATHRVSTPFFLLGVGVHTEEKAAYIDTKEIAAYKNYLML